MAPILHCVRHAQGFHNLGVEFQSLPDPRLTPYGGSQCAALQESLGSKFQSRLSLITASPLARTIHTAFQTFQPALEGSRICNPKILAVPDAQEISDFPCDTGSDVDVLKAMCARHGWPVDMSLVKEGWNVKTGRYAADSEEILQRARDARKLLRSKMQQLTRSGVEDVEVVLVSHGGYLHYFTGDWEDATSGLGTGWTNCELRSYTFVEDDSSDEARIVETAESRAKRGKQGPTKSVAEQERLFEDAMMGWESQGLQTPLRSQTQTPTPQNGPRVDEEAAKMGMEPVERTLTEESQGPAIKVSA